MYQLLTISQKLANFFSRCRDCASLDGANKGLSNVQKKLGRPLGQATVPTLLRLTPEAAKALRRRAEVEQRSLSVVGARAILRYVEWIEDKSKRREHAD
jgi:hypothetical protein